MDFFKRNATSRYPTDILLGELFVKAGIITQKQLDDTVKSAGAKHLHIGQMLVMSGFIKQRDIDCAVDAQSLLRDKVVDMNQAAQCLKMAIRTGASVMQLVKDQQAQGTGAQTNRLGELLLEAGIINRNQLSAAMQRSMSTGLPLGRILVLNNSLSDGLLRFSLELQVRVRDGMMDRDEAIENLRAEATAAGMKVGYYDGSPGDSSVNLKPLKQKVVRLGELLVAAGFLTETDVMSCLELGLMTERPIGEVMVEQGYIGPDMLQVALTVQQMVEDKVYNKEEAGETLAQIRDTGIIVPLVQDVMDGRFVTGSYSVHREEPPDPFSPGEMYDEVGLSDRDFTQTSDTANAVGDGYDLAKDLKEFENAGKAPKTGRHSSSRSKMPAEKTEFEARPVSDEPVVHAMPAHAANFEEAPSLESLMAGFGGETSDSNTAVAGADTSFAPDSAGDKGQNGKSGPIVLAPPAVPGKAAPALPPNSIVLTAAPAHPFEELLLSAKVISVEDIQHALEQARTNPLLLAEVLQQTGFLTEVGRTAALDCHNLVTNEKIDKEKGAQVLDHCINLGRLRNITLGDALEELGLDVGYKPAEAEAKKEEKAAKADSIQVVQAKEAPAKEEPVAKQEALPKEEPVPASEIIVDTMIADLKIEESKEEKAEEESQEADLLSMFGLTEGAAAASETAAAKSGQAGAVAESLMASMSTPADAKEAMTAAESARPEAFQTTAVFKSIADEELDRASSMVIDEGGSLDSLMMRLEGGLADSGGDDKSEEKGNDAGQGGEDSGNGLGQAVPDFATYINSDDADSDSMILEHLTPADTKGNGGDQDLTKRPTEEVDLRSLFSSLSVDASQKLTQDKPAEPVAAAKPAEAEKEAAPKAEPVTAAAKAEPEPAAKVEAVPAAKVEAEPAAKVEAVPAAKAEAAPAAKVEAEPAVKPEAAAAPKIEAAPAPVAEAAPAKVETAPAAKVETAPAAAAPAAASPAAASPVAAAPAAAPVAADASKGKASEHKLPAQSKLPTMSDDEMHAAKAAQISAMASALTKMAEMHYEGGNYAEAQKAYERILSWRQGELGSTHIDLVDDLNNLAGVMCVQELFDQAEPMIRRAVEILENAEKLEPLRLADNLTSLAGLQFRLGVFEKAEPLLSRSLMLREQELGAEHTDLADPLRDYAKLLKKLGRVEDSEQYYSRAKILIARRKAAE